jgi:hypothetical protein
MEQSTLRHPVLLANEASPSSANTVSPIENNDAKEIALGRNTPEELIDRPICGEGGFCAKPFEVFEVIFPFAGGLGDVEDPPPLLAVQQQVQRGDERPSSPLTTSLRSSPTASKDEEDSEDASLPPSPQKRGRFLVWPVEGGGSPLNMQWLTESLQVASVSPRSK